MNGLVRVEYFDNMQSREVRFSRGRDILTANFHYLLHMRFFVHISQMPALIRRYSTILTSQVFEGDRGVF